MLQLNKQSKLMHRNGNFNLSKSERYALESELGYLTGNIDDTGWNWNYDKYEQLLQSYTDKEQKTIKELYELISDERNWPEVSEKILSEDEILLIQKVINDMIENNLIDEENQYDIANILDKI